LNPDLKTENLSENDKFDIMMWNNGVCGRFSTPEEFEKSLIERNIILKTPVQVTDKKPPLTEEMWENIWRFLS
jgi:hypothetical protein